jgi:hypothetical protein
VKYSGHRSAPGARPQRIVGLGLHRQPYHPERPPGGFRIGQGAACQVILVPAGLDQHHAPAGLEPCQQVGSIPVPGPLAARLAVGVLTRPDRIVDQHQIGTAPGDGPADTGREILPALHRLPAPGSLAVRRQGDVEHRPVFEDQIAHLAAPAFGQLLGVRSRDNGALRAHGQQPRWKQYAGIGALGRTGRQEYREPIALAAGDSCKLVNDDVMMRRRLEAAQPTPFSERSADPPPGL